jgi:hypothetical protein
MLDRGQHVAPIFGAIVGCAMICASVFLLWLAFYL